MVKWIGLASFLLFTSSCSSTQKAFENPRSNPQTASNISNLRVPASKDNFWNIGIRNITTTDLNFQLKGEMDQRWNDLRLASGEEGNFPTNGRTFVRIMTGDNVSNILTYELSSNPDRRFLLAWSDAKNLFVVQKLFLAAGKQNEHWDEADLVNPAP